ncbi:MAG: M14 family zinc carboxypeptidase [Planctomycetia bacterium]
MAYREGAGLDAFVAARLAAWRGRGVDVVAETYGQSAGGRSLQVLRLGGRAGAPCVLVHGGLGANDAAGTAAVLDLAERLASAESGAAREAWQLAFASPPHSPAPALDEALARAWHDRLASARAHQREAARQPSRARPCAGSPAGPPAGPLYLGARVGQACQLARLARQQGLRLASVEGVPQRPGHAAPSVWLGQPALRSTRRIARALAAGREVRLLLALPGMAWHASPDLAGASRAPGEVLQHALDALALVARARPDLVDWSQPRGRLRATLARQGLASWTRLAPWAAPGAGRAPRAARPRKG